MFQIGRLLTACLIFYSCFVFRQLRFLFSILALLLIPTWTHNRVLQIIIVKEGQKTWMSVPKIVYVQRRVFSKFQDAQVQISHSVPVSSSRVWSIWLSFEVKKILVYQNGE